MTAYTGLRFSSGKIDFLPFIWGEIGLTQMIGRTNLSLAEKAGSSFPGSRLPCSPPCSRRGSLGTRKKGSWTHFLGKDKRRCNLCSFQLVDQSLSSIGFAGLLSFRTMDSV